MAAVGYALVFSYVFFLIFVLGSAVQKRTNIETSRKVIHTMLFMVWVFIDLFFQNSIHQIIIPVSFLLLNSLSFKFHIYKSVEREDDNHMGTIFFAIAITVVMTIAYFWPEMYLPSGAAAFCLTFGDGFAALIGYNFKSRKVRESKSLLGMGACFAASAGSLFLFKWLYWPQLDAADVLLLAAVSAIAELTGGGLDNFTVTFGVFGISWILGGVGETEVQVALTFAVIVFAIVFLARAIDYRGSVLAMFMVFAFRYFGGATGLFFLLTAYFVIFFVALIRKRLRPPIEKKKSSGRTFMQILINGGIGTICMVLYGMTKDSWLFALAITAVGGCFIDSVSSDVGVLSRQEPYDPLKRQKVPTGISGGVTVLGTSAALCCSALIAVYAYLGMQWTWPVAAVVGGMVFLQTLLDTALGSLLQVKYRCADCNILSEKKTHCGKDTVYAGGIRWINNNMVNLLSSVAITSVAAFVLRAMM